MSDEHSSFFYDTIVFHQNMLVGSYDDRCYTDILLPVFSSRRRVLVPVSQEPPGYHELHDSVRIIMQCAHKNLATSDLLLKSELLRLFYLLASTPGLCTEHTVSTESRMTETLRPHLYTETSFRICYHRAAGKDRSYEQQLLYELFQTEFRSRSH